MRPGRILPVTTADDIDLFLDAKAAFYLRLSDECLYHVTTIDKLVQLIGRTRYRWVGAFLGAQESGGAL